MSESAKTILLIADISGYTKFMRQETISLSHAKQIIVRLLRAMMQSAKPPLKVAELEGDAVFFYARAAPDEIERLADDIKSQVMDIFFAFKTELHAIDALTTCSCDACDHVHDLQLKQVIHVGDVEVEQIEQFEKLFGLDVILVHRLLKNSVTVNEYVMMTNPIYRSMKGFYGLQAELFKESFEGIGEVETLVFYPKQLSGHGETPAAITFKPSQIEKFKWRTEMTVKTLLDVAGLRRNNE